MPKVRELAPHFTCSADGCDALVAPRRPSASGLHFCKRRECQAIKQKTYQAAKTQRKLDTEDQAKQALMQAALHSPRVPCPECGLVNGLLGWAHRAENGHGCVGLGSTVIKGRWVDIVWPEPRQYRAAPPAPAEPEPAEEHEGPAVVGKPPF